MIEFDKEKAVEIAKNKSFYIESFFESPEINNFLDNNDFVSLLNQIKELSPDRQEAVMCVLLLSDIDLLSYIHEIPSVFNDLPITKIKLPTNISSTSDRTFMRCKLLEYVEIPGTIVELHNADFFLVQN